MKTDHIEKGNYVGYVWYSDETSPCLLTGEEFTNALDPHSNPFIIEGQLFDPVAQISYSIRYVDGGYHVQRWDLTRDFESEDFTFTPKDFEAHPRMNKEESKDDSKVKKVLLFRQYWQAVEDDMCLGMKVLQPHAFVFVGIKEIKED